MFRVSFVSEGKDGALGERGPSVRGLVFRVLEVFKVSIFLV